MIIMIAEVVTHPGKDRDYEQCFRELQAVVAVKEPRTLVYQSARCREEPLTYRAVEIFADQSALDFHADSEWLKEGWVEMEQCIARLKVTVHDPIVTPRNRLSSLRF
jgi:quinol monooxygenase YgiN